MTCRRLIPALLLAAANLFAQTPDPTIQKLLADVSADHIATSLKTLVAFQTRSNYGDSLAAPRKWIESQFRANGPALDVSIDAANNVIAVLKGTTQPDKRLVIGGHYDSTNKKLPNSPVAPAPGADDDASGVAVTLELARVFSHYRFQKTIVFIAFAGEEIGLVGSTRYSSAAKARGEQIEAMLNNDIVGANVTESTHPDLDGTDNDIVPEDSDTGNRLRVYSPDPDGAPSRKLAQQAKQLALRYVPGIRIDLVLRGDRYGRNGDQTPFQKSGYPAIRFTSASENTDTQHTPRDTLDGVSPPFAAEVARINAALLATLAMLSK